MGQMIVFKANGEEASGYLAAESKGPGVVVIQEWWGLVDHIKDVCDRLSAQGFVALAPDLYRGASTTEPDEAGKLMMDLRLDEAAKDMKGAVDYLLHNSMVEPKKIGSVGFCMGGRLSLYLATQAPIDACVNYYGPPDPSWNFESLKGPVLAHFAEHDDWGDPPGAKKIFDDIGAAGTEVQFHVYPGTQHAFFNDSRPDVFDAEAAELSWDRTLDFFRKHLRA